MIHWFRADRPGQSRGPPDIPPSLPLFAQLRQYRQAVLAELNGHAFSRPVSAVRAYLPVYELAEMTDLHVTVVPRGQRAGRGLMQTDCTIDVAVQQKPADLRRASR